MSLTRLYVFALAASLITGLAAHVEAQEPSGFTLLVGESSSENVCRALAELNDQPEIRGRCQFHLFTGADLAKGAVDSEAVSSSRTVVVNATYRELLDYAEKNADSSRTKIYGVRQEIGTAGRIICDPRVDEYFGFRSAANFKNLILFLLCRDWGLDVEYEPPKALPDVAIFHPVADRVFESFLDYQAWYQQRGLWHEGGFWVGIPDSRSHAVPGETGRVVSALITQLEQEGINVLPVYSYPGRLAIERFFFEPSGERRVDVVVSFSLKMAGVEGGEPSKLLTRMGVPVIDATRLHYGALEQWREGIQGVGVKELTWQICNPEVHGLIEPTLLGAKEHVTEPETGRQFAVQQPIQANIHALVRRIRAWHNLATKPNRDKRIVVMYWNHPPGKQNVGASYLNVCRSIEQILARLRDEGYTTSGEPPSEDKIKDLILKSGRNIGSWVPGELDALIKSGDVVRIPMATYKSWYEELDREYRQKCEAQWGTPEASTIMVSNGEFILPCVNLGNVVLMPQPSRGWGDDPTKLYHSPTLYPHHQYTAFYLWLKHEFKADAVVSLGKHGTHEWLPGKQTALSQSCPPDVLMQDIPNLYPYIVDNIGEGIQAKRRGRGVIIDHLIPALTKAGAYEEYRDLSVTIDEYHVALTQSEELAAEKLGEIRGLSAKLGLDRDLSIEKMDADGVEAVEHYLLEMQEAAVPYGMHTFGASPTGKALDELSGLIHERNPQLKQAAIRGRLQQCGLEEMNRLIAGLNGQFIPPGEGNDPLRNPDAIPTGNNFYGFDPAKVPSRAAYALGKRQAEEMIEKYRREKSEFPASIGLVLWATEIQRNEGSQVGTALYLMGMKPVWDKNGAVTGTEPIPGTLLGRPRIDVHIQASGLMRDSFPTVMHLLDDAARKASRMSDVENYLARHSRYIRKRLIDQGYSQEDADDLSRARVFSEAPGSYSLGVQTLVPSSGIWNSDDEIADVFIHHASYAYGGRYWGRPVKAAYKESLKNVKITMHTRSSAVYGVLDNDDSFGYLGGLSLAVRHVAGKAPDVLISDQKNPADAHIEKLEKTLGRELRARYLNPKWIEGMKQENYAGAREMDKFVEYMWGWQVTVPSAVDQAKWQQTYAVYVEDKYGLDLKNFFAENNAWAIQSISARMLEAVRKGYWDAPAEVRNNLARHYANSVINHGLACCDHTCNNPALNQMVVGIISVPGFFTPEVTEQFKVVVAKATGNSLEEAVDSRKQEQKALAAIAEDLRRDKRKAVKAENREKKQVEGYEVIEQTAEKTTLTSSGAAWATIFIVLTVIALILYGSLRKAH